jgi:RNA polymerase sigma-70 factor (ECF subfamily)
MTSASTHGEVADREKPDEGGRTSVERASPDVIERYRRELTGYSYRMLGSGSEAEDAVQETMVRAWRSLDGFEGRSSLRSWLYRIATNVCLDMLRGRERRARPMDLGPNSTADAALGAPQPEHAWVQPIADTRVIDLAGDPAELAAARDSIRLAFVAALQHLPPKQRAVLILREVLRWKADEVAELLDTSVASVNSALQRGRATLDGGVAAASVTPAMSSEEQALLARYVDAFERYDIAELVSLIHEDATFSMPPFALWLQGPAEISKWYLGQGIGCRGSRLVATQANGVAAFGAYKLAADGGREPFALQLIETDGERLVGLHHFLGPELFVEFGLPARLGPDD